MDRKIGDQKAITQFLGSYALREMVEGLEHFQDSFPLHRSIYGDGNCFYRAFAFMYLRNASVTSFSSLFKNVQIVCEARGYLRHLSNNTYQKLEEYWGKGLSDIMREKNVQKKESMIQDLFNRYQEFDALLILYFRSLNYEHISLNQSTLTSFMQSPRAFNQVLQRIKTYGEESEGVEIDSLVEYFHIGMTVISVKERNIHPIVYDHYHNPGFYFLYRPGHYDVIYPVLQNSSYETLRGSTPISPPPSFVTKQSRFSIPKLLGRNTSQLKQNNPLHDIYKNKPENTREKFLFSKEDTQNRKKFFPQPKATTTNPNYIKEGPGIILHKFMMEFIAVVLLVCMVSWIWY